MAAADVIRVTVSGRGGHASAPQDALDPVPAAAAMVGALQTAITRRVDTHQPVVLTIAHIIAGTTDNVIPETAFMEGTLRTMSEATRTQMHEEIRRVCRYTALAHGCAAGVEIVPGYPVTVNDDAATARIAARVRRAARAGAGDHHADTRSWAPRTSPTCWPRCPARWPSSAAARPALDPTAAPPNHSNRVIFDEDAMAAGVAVYAGLALEALAPDPGGAVTAAWAGCARSARPSAPASSPRPSTSPTCWTGWPPTGTTP